MRVYLEGQPVMTEIGLVDLQRWVIVYAHGHPEMRQGPLVASPSRGSMWAPRRLGKLNLCAGLLKHAREAGVKLSL